MALEWIGQYSSSSFLLFPKTSMDDIRRAAPKSKVLNRDRARFEVAGGDYRLIAAFDFRRQIAFVKFIGTHAEYDAIDALTVARF
jgi:mRNA interferase HigB